MWPPRKRPEAPAERRTAWQTVEARAYRGLADELVDDLAAVQAWAPPRVARDAAELQTDLLRGPARASSANVQRYYDVWLEAFQEPAQLSALDPDSWRDVVNDAIEDLTAQAKGAGRTALRVAGVTLAVVTVAGLVYAAAKLED